MFKLPDGSLRIIVQGLARVRLTELVNVRPYLRARIEEAARGAGATSDRLEIDALQRNIKTNFQQIVSLSPLMSDDLQTLATNIAEPGRLADFIASSLGSISTETRQEVLETLDVRQRLDLLNRLLIKELEVLELGSKIQSQVQSEVGKNQRDYFLREQLKAIQRELGEGDDQTKEIEELRTKIEAAGMPETGQEGSAARARSPVEDAAGGGRIHGVAHVSRLADCAAVGQADRGGHRSAEDARRARQGALGPREGEGPHPRIPGGAEAQSRDEGADPVLRRTSGSRQDVAGASRSRSRSGRKFVRVSLGGMRDEAEIRGHRRTYIGALPGQIIQGLRRAESKNPLFILDEIDKLGSDFRGDPASALLEVLDPEQNSTFRDHYLDVPFDLSEVLFITTANILDPVPPPLRDRMEVLELAGYTEEEKLAIARDHLVERQVKNHGLTREAGDLHRCRAARRSFAATRAKRASAISSARSARSAARSRGAAPKGRPRKVKVTPDLVQTLLGAPRFLDEEMEERTKNPGVAIGLAWTPVGGEVLLVEASRMAGSGSLTLTGQLGEVMKESARAALSWVRAHATEWAIDPDFFKGSEIHMHVPSGAIPKDGPSAGVTMVDRAGFGAGAAAGSR